MPQQTPVVFISSTKEDLEAYRVAARDAAIRAGLMPRMMEYFVAQGAKPPYAECMEKVDEADVLVVIVSHRYGWVPPDQPAPGGKSITWLECEQALKNGREVLAFLVDEKAEWPLELKESYRVSKAIEEGKPTTKLAAEVKRNVAKLKEFKGWLSGLGIRGSFSEAGALRGDIEAALNGWLRRQTGATVAPGAARQDPSKYLAWLRQETAWIDIRGLQVGSGKAHRFPIDELYIPLTTPEGKPGEKETERAMRQSVALEEALQRRKLVIVGDPGSGKTTFLRRIAYELCGDAGKLKLPGSGFPILVRIGELEEHMEACLCPASAGNGGSVLPLR